MAAAAAMMRSRVSLLHLCAAALFVPLLLPLMTGRVFTWDDLAAFHLPIRHLYRQALRDGDSILWSPALYSGVYLFGEGQAGMAHPVHWLLYRALPLNLAFNIELASSYAVALAGMWLLLRRSLSVDAAWFGAIAFAFSGFNLLHLGQMNAVAVIAHLPWLLLVTTVLMTTRVAGTRAIAFAAAVVTLASQLLLGYPQYVWLTLFADGWLVVWLVWRGASASRLLLTAAALMLGVCVGAVQVLPTLEVLRDSSRAAPSLDFRLAFSIVPVNLIQLWSPYAFAAVAHDAGVYSGAVCTVAIAWVIARGRRLPRCELAWALLAFAALALLLALGGSGGIYPWLSRIPLVSTFRAPARFVALAHAALAVIAAIVFEDLARLASTRPAIAAGRLWPLFVPVVLSAATSVGIAAMAYWYPGDRSIWGFASGARAAFGFAILMIATVLFGLASRGIPLALPLLAILTTIDIGLWGYRYAWRITPPRAIETLASEAALPNEAKPEEYLLPNRNQELANRPVLRGYRLSGGYLGLPPQTTVDYEDQLSQRLAGVRWRFDRGVWIRVTDSMPRARLIAAVRASKRVVIDIRTIDLRAAALVGERIDGLGGNPGEAIVVSDRPGRIVVRTIAPGRQLLVLTERFHRGWRAIEDATERPAIRVNGDYLGCVVEPGAHEITFLFAPWSARAGEWLTWAGLAITAASAWLLARGRLFGRAQPVEASKKPSS
jgi:hypothetical protein